MRSSLPVGSFLDNTASIAFGAGGFGNVLGGGPPDRIVIRDDTGAVIQSGTAISLSGNGHTAFVLSDLMTGFPITANKRGTIEFDTPAGGQISVLGLRFSPPNSALTTIPALVNCRHRRRVSRTWRRRRLANHLRAGSTP